MGTLTPTTDVEASIQNGERRYTRTPFQHSNIKQCPSYKRFTPDANGKNQQKKTPSTLVKKLFYTATVNAAGEILFPVSSHVYSLEST